MIPRSSEAGAGNDCRVQTVSDRCRVARMGSQPGRGLLFCGCGRDAGAERGLADGHWAKRCLWACRR
jgi:hypothetical protein